MTAKTLAEEKALPQNEPPDTVAKERCVGSIGKTLADMERAEYNIQYFPTVIKPKIRKSRRQTKMSVTDKLEERLGRFGMKMREVGGGGGGGRKLHVFEHSPAAVWKPKEALSCSS